MNTTDNKPMSNGHKPTGLAHVSMELLPLIMNNIPQAVFWKDQNLVYLGCNQAFADDAGFSSPEDVIGKTDFDMPWKDQAELYRADDSLVMKTGEAKINYEEPQTTSSGSTIWLSTSKIPVRENGQVVAVLGMYEDITKRKQTEESFRESEERFRRFTEATLEGLVFHEKGTIIDVNPAALAMFSLSDNRELIGKNLLDFIVPESHKTVVQQMQLEAVLPYEIQCIRKDGTVFPVETSTRTYKAGDKTIRASSIRDITGRKQLESQVQEAYERRGYQVQVSTEVSQEIAAATETDDLFDRVVNLTKERFGYYHTQLLRYDPAQDAVVLINGYGATGQKMLAAGHKMPMGEGLIGTAAATGETVMRPTLADDPDWHPNPLLPKTKGEIAVPIKWQDNILGVLDVQSDQAGILAEDDRLLLEGLCGQIAIAMHSAELVEILRRNEARLAEALQIARLGNWEYDFENDLFHFTDEFYAIFRTTAEKVGGYKISSADYAKHFVHPEDAPLVGTEIQKVLDAKDRLFTTQLEHRIIFSDGEVGYISVNINVERDENGKITRWYGANQDITERKKAEEALRINEARLAEALKIARLGNWEYDFENDLFHFTDEFYAIFRTTAEKVGGYKISSADYAKHFVHPEDAPLVGTEIQKVLDAKDRLFTTQLEHRIIFSDGEVGYISVNINVERDENGKITRWYGANQDITERKKAEEALRANEARLAEALTAAHLANWEYDVEKDIFTFNDQFYSIFHTTAEKVGGYQLSSARYAELFVHPDDLNVVGTEIGKALNSTERVYNTNIDHRILYADGGVGYITVKLTVERDENGKITRYYGANQDITERKQSEEALRVNEARLAEALTAAHLANWEYDVEKDLFTFNDQFYSIFHTSVDKVGGYQLSSARYAALFVHPDDMEIVGAEIGKALNSKEKVYNAAIDHRILYADGGIGYITVKLTVERDDNGKIIRYYGANQDITEQRKAQEEMAERLEEINRLYRSMSQEGWKTYRETADLPKGYMFDQTGIKPVEETALDEKSFASIPMKVLGGEVVGSLSVADDPQRPMSEDDLVFLQQASDQIALALEGARLAAQTQFALAQSEKLFDASRRLTETKDIQELTAAAVESINIPVINRSILCTLNYNTVGDVESMDVIANWWNGTGYQATAVGTHYPLEMVRMMKLFVSPTPLFFEDALIDERVDPVTMELVKKLNLRAVAVLPLHVGTSQLGLLMLEGEEPHNFTQEETRLFTALGPQIATVLENRRQFERAQKQANREAMLNTINQKIQSATSVEAVLQIAARELGHALGAPMTIAQLSMKDKSS